MHHAWGHSNYGLYFTWWDRLCGTEHPRYRDELWALLGRLHGPQEPQTQAKTAGQGATVALLLAVGLAATSGADSAAAQDVRGGPHPIHGEWATHGYSARVVLAPCTDATQHLCGVITWLWEPTDRSGRPMTDTNNADPTRRERPLLGLTLLSGFRPGPAPGTWVDGQIYNPEDGQTYRATLKLSGQQHLEVQGCVLMFCSRQVWWRLPLR